MVQMPAPPPLSRADLRFTVDTPADLDFMRRVFGEAGEVVAVAGVADRRGGQGVDCRGRAVVIPVTRLDGTPMIVNTDQIAWVEYIPDTVISLMNGEKLIVRETPEIIVDRVREFRRAICRPLAQPSNAPRAPLSVVDSSATGRTAVKTRRLDLTSVIGVPLGLGFVLLGQVLEGGTLQSLLQVTAAVIVFGGTFGAVLLEFVRWMT